MIKIGSSGRLVPLIVALSLVAISDPVAGQEKSPIKGAEQVAASELLKELETLPPQAWADHLKKLQVRIAASEDQGRRLRKEAEALLEKAAAADQAAARLKDRVNRDLQIMRILGVPSPAAAPKASARTVTSTPKKADAKPAPAQPNKPPAAPAAPPEPKGPALVAFEEQVLPVFEQHCVGCHDSGDQSGGLDLESFSSLMQGGSSGSVVKAGNSDESRLYLLASHKGTPTMPPDQGMIPEEQVERIRLWIQQGAHATRAAAKSAAPPKPPKKETPKGAQRTTAAKPPSLLPASDALSPVTRTAHPPMAKAAATSPVAPLLAVPGRNEVVLWRTDTLEVIGALPFPHGRVEALRFSRTGERLLAAGGIPGRQGGAVLYDIRTGKVLHRYGREFDTVLAVDFSPRESLVVMAGPSKKVRVFSTETEEKLFEIKEHGDWILAVAVSPDGNYIASGDRAGVIFISEADTGLNVHKLRGHGGAVNALSWRPDAARLVSASEDGTMRFWEMEDGKSRKTVNGNQGQVLSLTWSSRSTLASGGSTGVTRLWKTDGGALGALPSVKDWVYSLAFDPEGARLFAGSWSGRVTPFDVKTKKPIKPEG